MVWSHKRVALPHDGLCILFNRMMTGLNYCPCRQCVSWKWLQKDNVDPNHTDGEIYDEINEDFVSNSFSILKTTKLSGDKKGVIYFYSYLRMCLVEHNGKIVTIYCVNLIYKDFHSLFFQIAISLTVL